MRVIAPHGRYTDSAAHVALANAVSVIAAVFPEDDARRILALIRQRGTERFGDVDGATSGQWLDLVEEVLEDIGAPPRGLLA